MGVSFRKRVKIAPGDNLNFSKSGVSASVGPKGAKLNVGKKGTYLNTSIPGTGIYSRQKISGSQHSNNISNQQSQSSTPSVPVGLAVFLWIIVISIFIFAILL